jgi:hypothetical protein
MACFHKPRRLVELANMYQSGWKVFGIRFTTPVACRAGF